jgi:hypothetical protein
MSFTTTATIRLRTSTLDRNATTTGWHATPAWEINDIRREIANSYIIEKAI